MRMLTMILAISAMLFAGACADERTTEVATTGQNQPAAAAPQNLTPEELGELGARIEKNPGDAQRLLSERGLNEESFEQAVRKVSEDPAAAKRYSDAYKRTNA